MRHRGFTLVELAIVVAIAVAMIVILMPFVQMTRNWANKINCANNLRRISLGLHAYSIEHQNRFPSSLRDLYPRYVKDARAFDCPADKHIGTPESPDYDYTASLIRYSPGGIVIAEDKPGNHGRLGKNVLKINGAVDWVEDRGAVAKR